MRRRISRWCARIIEALRPKLDQAATIKHLSAELALATSIDRNAQADYMESVAELQEARQMFGSGPWQASPAALEQTDQILKAAAQSFQTGVPLRETIPIGAVGATGDISLALENLEWRREGALGWLEFSRWGIQQIILICRLNYIKNPLIRRGINISAAYVFGRGFEVSSDNQAADDTLKAFFEDNKTVLGQIAISELHKRKFYDGNLFFVFFADAASTGNVKARTIDATEIMEVITNPQDSDEPWFFRRKWVQHNFEPKSGAVSTTSMEAYYPALGFDPETNKQAITMGISAAALPAINSHPLMWDNPILHRKCGAVSKWHFGCPLAYPALSWAKASRKLLEDCATVRRSLAQIAWQLTTKGGQQALEGAKQQLSTNVGPPMGGWDTNPTAVAGSTFASGPGTTMKAMNTSGAGGNPEDVRRYIHWVAMVFGIPETFFADASVGTVATAQSLDRPTELNFLQQQEEWREDLATISQFVLNVSKKAAGGKLRESLGIEADKVIVMECKRITRADGARVYEKAAPSAKQVKVQVNFPGIREGDLPVLVAAWVEAMTLGNKGGQIVGIDEKEGVKGLFALLGVEDYQDIADEMYPDKEYEIDRTKEIIPPPVPTAPPINPGGAPQPQPNDPLKATPKPASAAPSPAAGNKEAKRISRNRHKVLLERFWEAAQKLKARKEAA